ncbi:DUF4190 domain-containing protein [Streptomyces sp. NPDC049687]|uniref:DUF4190 domain-containing protein n=1 Tax=Streptomyces sp. NPDC049687 TaxID=3365596 RepID=UPI0037A9A579
MPDHAPTPADDAGRDPWPAPASDEADGPQDAAPKVSLDKRAAAADPWAAPGDGARVGPGHTVAANEPVTQAPPADSAPRAWNGPGPLASFPPPNPATAAGGPPPDPFAPPVARNGAVPPPPISPDGPGQIPYGYGYPGGYGYPSPPQGSYWPGTPQGDSNGLGVTGMVLGIVSAVIFCLWPVAIVVGVLGVVFGAIGRAKANRGEADNPGQALAGIICGAAGIALGAGLGLLILLLP